jgi:hypothetical protein
MSDTDGVGVREGGIGLSLMVSPLPHLFWV